MLQDDEAVPHVIGSAVWLLVRAPCSHLTATSVLWAATRIGDEPLQFWRPALQRDDDMMQEQERAPQRIGTTRRDVGSTLTS
ncbi:MAG: hypothetical protein ACT4P7_22865 [Gemmatimonadaceae bacterium]